MMKKWLRKLRGALGNATLWAGVWSLATLPILGVLHLLGFSEMFSLGGLLHVAPRIAASLAGMGFVAGGAFSAYLGIAPSRRLRDLKLLPLGVVGVLFGGLMVPMFPWLPAAISFLSPSFPVAFGGAVAIAGVMGGATAVGSVKVAQYAAIGPGSEAAEDLKLEPGETMDSGLTASGPEATASVSR